jgi:aminomethyltransferase
METTAPGRHDSNGYNTSVAARGRETLWKSRATEPMSATLMTPPLAKTPLYDWHVAHRGRMVDFAGWSMPVQYESIVAEHEAVRNAVGLFDISHMGRLTFSGAGATEFLDGLLTRRVSDMQPGQIRYSLMTNDAAGILDDVLLYRLQAGSGRDGAVPYLLVVNASNRQKILDWIGSHLEGHGVVCSDETFATAMIAVQGPAARKIVAEVVETDLSAMRYYHGRNVGSKGELNVISRTGYTGEDGYELIVPATAATVDLWDKILAAGRQSGARPIGLGARDTLRLEAAMPLYGHELSESIDPFTAGLDFAVNLENRNFPGRDALARIARAPRRRVRVGLELAGKRVPREGYVIRRGSAAGAARLHGVLHERLGAENDQLNSLDVVELFMELEEEFDINIPDLAAENIQTVGQAIEYIEKTAVGAALGEVSSGTFSPTLKRPIAMAYVQADAALPGTEVAIDIRGQMEPARVVPLPFYRRPKSP